MAATAAAAAAKQHRTQCFRLNFAESCLSILRIRSDLLNCSHQYVQRAFCLHSFLNNLAIHFADKVVVRAAAHFRFPWDSSTCLRMKTRWCNCPLGARRSEGLDHYYLILLPCGQSPFADMARSIDWIHFRSNSFPDFKNHRFHFCRMVAMYSMCIAAAERWISADQEATYTH